MKRIIQVLREYNLKERILIDITKENINKLKPTMPLILNNDIICYYIKYTPDTDELIITFNNPLEVEHSR